MQSHGETLRNMNEEVVFLSLVARKSVTPSLTAERGEISLRKDNST